MANHITEYSKRSSPMPPRLFCACGCGEPTPRDGKRKRWRKFLYKHSSRVQPSGASDSSWKGGERTKNGYVLLKMPSHHRADAKGYVSRCVVEAEKKIGRPLRQGEVVHHVNHVRNDDRHENLDVLPSQSVHIALHNRLRGKRK